MPKERYVPSTESPAIRLTQTNQRLFVIFAICVCAAVVVAYWFFHPPSLFGLPHTRDAHYKSLDKSLRGMAPGDRAFRTVLRSAGTGTGDGWFVSPGKEVFPLGATVRPLPEEVPQPCWEGVPCFLLQNPGLIQFFPHRKDGVVWGVSVFQDRPERYQKGKPNPVGRFAYPPGLVLVLFLLMLGAFSMTLLLLGKLDRPLGALRKALHILGPENLDFRMETKDQTLPELETAFNEMAHRLAELQRSLEEQTTRAKSAEASRRNFLQQVSTALKGPVQTLRLRIRQLLTDESVDQDAALSVSSDELGILSVRVRRLLELSRWEQSLPESGLSEIPFLPELMKAVSELSPVAESQGCSLRFVGLAGASKIRILGDSLRLHELFYLFLEDALRDGAGHITVDIKVDEKAVRVRVTDDRLSRGSLEHDLSLTIAGKLVELHGGRLESDFREGAVLEFRLRRVSE